MSQGFFGEPIQRTLAEIQLQLQIPIGGVARIIPELQIGTISLSLHGCWQTAVAEGLGDCSWMNSRVSGFGACRFAQRQTPRQPHR